MNVESFVYGLLVAIAIVFVMWRMGVPLTPWRQALVGVLLGIALWLVLRVAGVDDVLAIPIGFLGGSLVVRMWRRFVRRPADPVVRT